MTIDHFEGDLVVVVRADGVRLDLPHWMVPAGAGEGDVLRFEEAGAAEAGVRIEVRVDRAATAEREREAAARLERLRGRDPGGDLPL